WAASAARHAVRSNLRFLNISHSQNGISGSTTTSVGFPRRQRTSSVQADSRRPRSSGSSHIVIFIAPSLRLQCAARALSPRSAEDSAEHAADDLPPDLAADGARGLLGHRFDHALTALVAPEDLAHLRAEVRPFL